MRAPTSRRRCRGTSGGSGWPLSAATRCWASTSASSGPATGPRGSLHLTGPRKLRRHWTPRNRECRRWHFRALSQVAACASDPPLPSLLTSTSPITSSTPSARPPSRTSASGADHPSLASQLPNVTPSKHYRQDHAKLTEAGFSTWFRIQTSCHAHSVRRAAHRCLGSKTI